MEEGGGGIVYRDRGHAERERICKCMRVCACVVNNNNNSFEEGSALRCQNEGGSGESATSLAGNNDELVQRVGEGPKAIWDDRKQRAGRIAEAEGESGSVFFFFLCMLISSIYRRFLF